MAAKVLDAQTLGLVFQSRPDILDGIKQAADSPARVALFNNIASFVQSQLNGDEPASKRRRVDIATTTTTTSQSHSNGHAAASSNGAGAGIDAAATEPVLLEIKDVSVAAPQRKKYDLCFTENFLFARASGSTVPVQGIVYPWRDIEHAFYLPVPDKSQVQHNYVLFPRNSYLPNTSKQSDTNEPPPLEPLVFTVPATAPKPGTIIGPSAASASAVSDSYSSLFNWALCTSLRSAGNSTTIIASDPKLFHSAARQPFRPQEKAVHVKAFRGSKDGFLFFLPTGILWGFKKPLLFLPLERIVALSYTSVLQRTFNIVVEYENVSGGEEEIEFAMLDQEDYGAIDESYVRRYSLADRSMAEQRKAKRQLKENEWKVKAEDGEGGKEEGQVGEGDDGMTELQRAQMEAEQQLQDEEDEEEEDYDPGSEGDSEGSGSDSDEEDDDDDDGDGGEEGAEEGDEEGDEDEEMEGHE
ncbi:putative chaperone protein [Apodospora peruviana]|uniref:Chaperone protein n=1 Tax=Apodospora peruviana TaxID=516989 RepID=A0AAE0HTT3_9PEZI|nr:putative chaperone protein [Apodospora peruviana]